MPISRRRFLQTSAGWGAAAALAAAAPGAWPGLAAAQDVVIPGKEKMIVRSSRYLDLEMPMSRLDSWITPVELFYCRNHMEVPSVNLAEWRLELLGEIERPMSFTLEELAEFEQASVTDTLECAGNGRAFYQPHAPGIQWQRGAVGTARFSGPRMAEVLRRAGLKDSAKHVAFTGLDEPPGKVPQFTRSIPIEKAMHPDTLLATAMNGAPLDIKHGFPVRALVPGWLGAASVKWLVELRVMDHPVESPFMKPGYSLPKRPVTPSEDLSPEDFAGITGLPVKSIIARPGDGSWWRRGPIGILGAAWAGEADVAGVDVSTDGGRSWQAAQLGKDHAHYAWRLWNFDWRPPGRGTFVLMSRAADSAGRQQPAAPTWNPSGYLWNAIDQVRVHVEG